MRLAERAGLPVGPRELDCLAALESTTLGAARSTANEGSLGDYRELATLLACDWRRTRPRRVGLAGGQGAGKSTLAEFIEAACAQVGLRCCVVSLDDFYLSRADRRALASKTHPLFETRGPPGTHDIEACSRAIDRLLEDGGVELPVFDKGRDDRVESRRVRGPFDLVLLEGWCVGARAVDPSAVGPPINALEAESDAGGDWRREIERRLRIDYEPLWDTLDAVVYLEVPGLDAIRRWRLQQESARTPDQRMDAEGVARFVQYFERLTERMIVDLPPRADWRVRLDDDHRVAGLARQGD